LQPTTQYIALAGLLLDEKRTAAWFALRAYLSRLEGLVERKSPRGETRVTWEVVQ
jgi:hypothetical protein